MESQIVKSAEAYVTELLKNGLGEDYRYHDLAHTLTTRDASLQIGQRYRLTDDELEVLQLAALFHDTGFTKIYDGHEEESKRIATDFLRLQKYPEDKISLVSDCIETTKVSVRPQSMLQKILKDADFNTSGGNYQEKSDALRHEWKVFASKEYEDVEWLQSNIRFWDNHQFYTGEGLAMFGEEKRKTLKKWNKELERTEGFSDGGKKKKDKDKGKDEVTKELGFAINSSKTSQLMFKTTLRNHVDLTNIADNKANMMLSVNSLLITLTISLLAAKIDTNPTLAYPISSLMLTCVLSIVFATLATRPVKMQGVTNLDMIGKGTTNLFFFGNFFKMNLPEYREGLLKVVNDETTLDNSIVTDLFFLGKALGVKFQRLRTCYSVFMVGMIVTVLIFVVTFLVTPTK